jgi:hypothetical protein
MVAQQRNGIAFNETAITIRPWFIWNAQPYDGHCSNRSADLGFEAGFTMTMISGVLVAQTQRCAVHAISVADRTANECAKDRCPMVSARPSDTSSVLS